MIDMESRVGRRIIGRIELGRPLEEALIGVCRKYAVEACEVRLTGILRDAVLLVFREEDAEYTAAYHVPGASTLVSFDGDISQLGSELLLNAKAVVAWDDRGFPRLAAGHLKSATVHSVEFVLDAFDDVVLERRFDPVTRLPLWNALSRKETADNGSEGKRPQPSATNTTNHGNKLLAEPKKRQPGTTPPPPASAAVPTRAPVRPPVPATPPSSSLPRPELRTREGSRLVVSMSDDPETGPEIRAVPDDRDIEVVRRPARKGGWADVVARSRELEEEEQEDQEREEEEEVDPVAGDILNHPKFGRCTVLRNDEDEVLVVRRPGGGTAPQIGRAHV